MIRKWAVSYTHLDVYKRQEKGLELLRAGKALKVVMYPEEY